MLNKWIRIFIHCSLTTTLMFHLQEIADSTCCFSNTIAFRLVNETEDCSMYNGEHFESGVCLMSICNDGTPAEGGFCGQGLCNFIGCNCEGGCRVGDPLEKFMERYGSQRIRRARLV